MLEVFALRRDELNRAADVERVEGCGSASVVRGVVSV